MKRQLDEVKRLQKIAGILKEDVNESIQTEGYNDIYKGLRDIQSHIETSSVLDTGFKEWALREIEAIEEALEEESWNEVVMTLEDIDDAIQQVDRLEYQEVYAPMLKAIISQAEAMTSENEIDEAGAGVFSKETGKYLGGSKSSAGAISYDEYVKANSNL